MFFYFLNINGTDRNNFYFFLNFISAPFPSVQWADNLPNENISIEECPEGNFNYQRDTFYKSMRTSTSQCRAKFLSFQNFPEGKIIW